VTPADAFAERLLAKFEVRQRDLTEILVSGYVPDYQTFSFLRGEIRMLLEAIEEVRDLLAPLISNDPFEGRRNDGA
jgi:cell fate (sporulation/competence/biofilm development) regulator YlbF (YheA/YmcA/DUF963 family)